MKRIAQNLALLAVTTAVGLGVAEVALRALYRAPWYMQLVGEQRVNQRLRYNLNQWGLRDVDPPPKKAGETRVFMIGDSFTFGLGVREDSFTLPWLLEQSLGVDVLNGGISGSHSDDWLELYQRVGPSYQPDLVTVVFFLRDGTRLDAMGSFFKPVRDEVASRNQSSRWYRHVYLYRYLRDALDRRKVGELYSTALTRAYTGDSTETVEWQAAQRNLLAMKELAERQNAKFALVIWPILAELDGPYPFQAICDVLEDFARRNGIPVHNMLPDYQGEEPRSLWVSMYDQHPNAKGHAIAAKSVDPFVREVLGLGQRTAAGERDVFTTDEYRVRVETVASGLAHPWGLAVLPDGRMLVTERPGRLRYVERDGSLSEPLGGVPEVFTSAEGGLLDLALDPAFADNRLVYLSYARPGEGGASTAVGRGRLTERSLEGFRVIFEQQPKTKSLVHFGSRLAFAPDGTLFVTLGDRGQRSRAQHLDFNLGKVIRINPDGSIPDDNPFVGRKDHRPEVWTYGHRNLQGAAIEPGTGTLWTSEHGPRGGDEVNAEAKGHNYGWSVITYGEEYAGGSIGEGTAKEGMEQPAIYWDPSIGPSGISFYTADEFEAWRGNLLVGALAGQALVRLVIEGNKVVKEERMLKDLHERIRAVRQAPDGRLYLITDSPAGRVLRLVPVERLGH
ncbi:MAG: PQQ-dependent sugar dehydrogenase [Gemmatimonadales bacterium]